MKIVLISQVSYPRLSPRAHRTTELAKEFARRGYYVVLYSLLGNYDYTDYSKETGIIFKNLGKSKLGLVDNGGYQSRNILIRAFNRFIGKFIHSPNIELIPMVKKAINNEGKIDLLVTIADPHVIHYAAAKSNRCLVKNWITDNGDPFMGNPFHSYPKYFEKYERYWCERCDYILVPIKEAVDAYYPEYREKIKVIPQGFNFDAVQLAKYEQNNVPTFAYSGVVYKNLRDPNRFLEYLSSLSSDFKFVVYTASYPFFYKYKEKLGDKLEIRERITRDKLLYELSKMDFLINIANLFGVQQPSKLIDYALTKRPILEISSNFNTKEMSAFNDFFKQDYRKQLVVGNVDKYNIKTIVNNIESLCCN